MRDYLAGWQDEAHCPQSGAAMPSGVPRPRQNMIWIVCDQLRSSALACHGDVNACTPNIDMMARMGLDFTHAYSAYPICSPFRGTMLTGLPHNRCVNGHEYPLPPDCPTAADFFCAQGYRTAYFGKWHLDGCRRNSMMHIVPRDRRGRFDTWIGYENNNSQYNTWVHGHRDAEETEQYQLKGYETDALTDLLLDYLERGGDKPFFAVLSVQPPHEPYVAPAEYLDHFPWNDIQLPPNVPSNVAYQAKAKKELARYYAMLEDLDTNVGRVFDALRRLSLELNTQVLFFSDHGDLMGSQGMYGKVVPFEEAARIPFIVSGGPPQYFGYETGETDALLTETDILPTSLALCGLPMPEGLTGFDYSHYRYPNDWPRFARRPGEPDSVYLKSPIPRGDFDQAWCAVVTRDGWKYACMENAEWLLFNLREDPFEERNLVHMPWMAAKRRELLALLRGWVEKTGDAFTLPDPAYIAGESSR
ncbi:MAG: sulfatase [Oscillospiraceae bacterium]|nr:sulfatase [Oscillospiraceae bacterium]